MQVNNQKQTASSLHYNRTNSEIFPGYLPPSLTLKMEAVICSETSLSLYRLLVATFQKRALHRHRCGNIKFNKRIIIIVDDRVVYIYQQSNCRKAI